MNKVFYNFLVKFFAKIIGGKLIILTSMFLLSACSSDPHEDYLGFWHQDGEEDIRIIEISRDGDTYLLDLNILQEKNFTGGKKRPKVLIKSENQLLMSSMMNSGTAIGLSENKNTLFYSGYTFSRLDQNALQKYVQQAQNNKEKCSAIRKKFREEHEKIKLLSFREGTPALVKLMKNYDEQKKKIPGCI